MRVSVHPLGVRVPAARSVFMAPLVCILALVLHACTPVISPQLMDRVDRNLT
jgi:hypothetical protein